MNSFLAFINIFTNMLLKKLHDVKIVLYLYMVLDCASNFFFFYSPSLIGVQIIDK